MHTWQVNKIWQYLECNPVSVKYTSVSPYIPLVLPMTNFRLNEKAFGHDYYKLILLSL